MSVSSTKSSPVPPLPFKITATTQLEDWKKWQRSFRYYANAINLDQKSHDFQLSTFKALIGPDGLEIYHTFSILDITDVESVIRKFDEHFKPKVNVTLERYKLYKLHQKSGQRFDDFLSDITNQVDKCEFRSMRDDIVLYKIVGGIVNEEVREVLLADADLKYDKAVRICRASSAMNIMSGKDIFHKSSAVEKKDEVGKTPKASFKEQRKSQLESAKKDVELSSGDPSFPVPKLKLARVVKKRYKKVSKKELKKELKELDKESKENVRQLRKRGVTNLTRGKNYFDVSVQETVCTDANSNSGGPAEDMVSAKAEGRLPSVVSLQAEVLQPVDLPETAESMDEISTENKPTMPAEEISKGGSKLEDGGSDGGHSDWGADDFHDDDDDDPNDEDYVVETTVDVIIKKEKITPKKEKKTHKKEVQAIKKEGHPKKSESEIDMKDKRFTCEECGKAFTSKYGLERHRGIHTGAHSEKGGCYYCGREFKKRYLRRHMVKSHPDVIGHAGPKVYSCEVCDFKTTFKTNIRRHQYQHTDEKPLACDLCEYKCITPRLMRAHVAKLHTGVRPYACPTCNRGFLQLDAMKRHQVTHLTPEEKKKHMERIAESCTCDVCGKVLSTRGALKTHAVMHTGEKPYACNICDYRSVNKSGLSSHMMKHSEEKPFICTVCGYSCKLKQTLQGHMNTHTGERPYPCKLCDSKFKQYPHLKRHMLTHTGEKPFVCDICGHRWTTQSNLKQHMKVHLNHSGDPSQYTPPRKRTKKPATKMVIIAPTNQPTLTANVATNVATNLVTSLPTNLSNLSTGQPEPAPPVPTANAIPQWSEQVSTINPIECFQSMETPPPFHPSYSIHQGNPRPPDCRYFQQRHWPNQH